MPIASHLDTVGVIAGWDEGTRGARGRALLHPSRLETNTFLKFETNTCLQFETNTLLHPSRLSWEIFVCKKIYKSLPV